MQSLQRGPLVTAVEVLLHHLKINPMQSLSSEIGRSSERRSVARAS